MFRILLCCFVQTASAQPDSLPGKQKIHFVPIIQAGMLEGEKGTSFLVQGITGIGYKGWYAGIGAGLDYYRFRGIPLFVDLRKSLFRQTSPLYVYVDAGIHFPWLREKERNPFQQVDYTNGFYYDAGVQYLLRLKNERAVSFSIGYSEKKIVEKIRPAPVPCLNPPCFQYNTEFNYQLRRIALKAGFWL